MSKNNTMDMVHGPLVKNILIYSIPMMFTSFIQILFNAVDTVVVGKFAGELSLAAVGSTAYLCFLVTSLFNGLAVGSNVVISNALGQNDPKKVEHVVHTSISLAVVCGILLALLGNLLTVPLLKLMSTPDDIFGLSELYIRIYFIGGFFMLVYNFGSSILRSKGDTKKPLYFLFISGLLNVILNLIFVIVFQWDVAGVAIATVISNAVAAILVIITLIKSSDMTHLDVSKLGIDSKLAFEIIRIGVPAGIQGMVFSLSNVVIQSSINSFDSSTIIAGNSVGSNVEGFVYIGMTAFSQACITFTGQNMGAKNYKRIPEIVWYNLIFTVIGGLGIGLMIWIFGEFFLGFYTNETAVIDVGMIRLTYVSLPLVLNGILDVFVCSLRGMGHSSVPTIIMIAGICGVRLLWIAIVFNQFHTLESIFLCYPVSWIVTGLVEAIMWFKTYRKYKV